VEREKGGIFLVLILFLALTALAGEAEIVDGQFAY
jgi:hypothetical protein